MRALHRLFAVGLLLIGGCVATSTPLAWGQDEINRKTKSRVAAVYPELAKRMNITGVEIGRASCRERGYISGVAVSFKKKKKNESRKNQKVTTSDELTTVDYTEDESQ